MNITIEAAVVGMMNIWGEKGYQKIRQWALKRDYKGLVKRSDLFRFSIGKSPYHVERFSEVVCLKRGLYDYEYFNICFFDLFFFFSITHSPTSSDLVY